MWQTQLQRAPTSLGFILCCQETIPALHKIRKYLVEVTEEASTAYNKSKLETIYTKLSLPHHPPAYYIIQYNIVLFFSFKSNPHLLSFYSTISYFVFLRKTTS